MSDFKDIQNNWDQVEPQLRKVRMEPPDLIHEITVLNERIHKHEQDGLEYEKLISRLAGRLNNLEKEFLRVIELYQLAGKA